MFSRNSVLGELRPWRCQLYVCSAIRNSFHFLEVPPSCPHYPPNLRKTRAYIERQEIRTLVFYHRLSRARYIGFNFRLRKILHLEHRWRGNLNPVLIRLHFHELACMLKMCVTAGRVHEQDNIIECNFGIQIGWCKPQERRRVRELRL
jgi:hypothetical protein